MKLFLGHIVGFTFMVIVCFVVLASLAVFLPVVGAFLAWSSEPLTIESMVVWFIARVILVLSAFTGIMVTTSKEGRRFAKEFAEDMKK